MGKVELAVDDGPSLGIHRVLVRRLAVRHTHRAVDVILRRVAIRILDEQIAGLCHGNGRATKGGVRADQISRCYKGVYPLHCRLGSEDPQCRSRDKMAKGVEGVVDGSVHAQKALSGSG